MPTIKEIKDKMEEARKQMREMGSAAIAEALQEFWPKIPVELESVTWEQYTDYFNDGDECIFHVHTDQEIVRFNGIEGDNLFSENSPNPALRDALATSKTKTYSGGSYEQYTLIDPLEAMLKFLGDSEEFLKTAVGDHLLVTACRDGKMETEEYGDHE